MLEKFKKQKKKQAEIDIFANTPTISSMFLPDLIQEKADYIKLGYNKYSRTFVMTIYPEQTWVGWLEDLSYIGNVNTSIKVEPANNGSVINQLTKKIVQCRSEYDTYSRQRKYTSFTRT